MFYPVKQCLMCRKLAEGKAKQCEKCGHEFRTDIRQILHDLLFPSTFLGCEMAKYDRLVPALAMANVVAFLRPASGIPIALISMYLGVQGFQKRDRAKDRDLRAGFYYGVVGLILSIAFLCWHPKNFEFSSLRRDTPGYYRPRLPGER